MPTKSSNTFTIPAKPPTGGGGDPLNLPLLDTSKITYQGSFKLPDSDNMRYGVRQGGIAYNPANDSIFVCGTPMTGGGGQNDRAENLAEFSIPTLVQTSSWNSLNTGTQLQGWVSACGGKQTQVAVGDLGNAVFGMLVYNNRLYISIAAMYMNWPTVQSTCGFYHDSLDLDTSNVVGPFAVGSLAQRGTGLGIGGLVPDNWKSTFGNYPMIWGGGGGASTVGVQYCNGPGMIFCDPNDFSQTTPAAFYPSVEDLGSGPQGDAPYSDTWTWMCESRATILLPESRTILAFGFHSDCDYYPGGQRAIEKARSRFRLFDARDVKDGFDGTVSYRTVTPYGYVDFNQGGNSIPFDEPEFNRGATWDASGRRLIESISKVYNSQPLFNVYHIAE